MRWKFLLFLMIIMAQVTEFMCFEAQSIFDPFGLRSRASSRSHSRQHEDYERSDEEEDKPGIRLPGLDFLNFGSRNGRDRERNRNRGQGQRRNDNDSDESAERVSSEVPQSRMGPSSGNNANRDKGEGKKDSLESSGNSSPCGEDNRFCHGENYVKELGLQWSTRVHNGTGIYLRDPNMPGGRRFVLVGIDQPNEKFGKCRTPENKRGHCRHLEYCVQDSFRSDFIIFLQYMCDIPNQNYIGVCCPEQNEEARTTRRPGIPLPGGMELPFPFPPFLRPSPATTTTTPSPSSRGRTTRRGSGRPPTTRRPGDRTPSGRSGPPPISRDCGISQRKMPRIVGGRVSDPKAWPWMAALLKKEDAVDYRAGQYCGGVLVSEFHVLTAGHCVDGFDVDGLAVRIGEYDFSRNDDTSSTPQDIDIADIFIHQDYNRYSYQNDIALIKLAKSAYFDQRIKSICLPASEDADKSLTNEMGIVTGFGTIYYGGPASDKLMEITVPIWPQEDCQASYSQPIDDTNLCAGVRSGSRDSCQGDSGGPLQVQLRGRWTTVGIVSWGIRCSEPGYPGVYTRVAKYLPWIYSRMRQ